MEQICTSSFNCSLSHRREFPDLSSTTEFRESPKGKQRWKEQGGLFRIFNTPNICQNILRSGTYCCTPMWHSVSELRRLL